MGRGRGVARDGKVWRARNEWEGSEVDRKGER